MASDRRALVVEILWTLLLAPPLLVTLSWLLRVRRPYPFAIVQAAFPWWALLTVVALLGSLVTRRWRVVVPTVAVLAVQVAAIAPAVGTTNPPEWAAEAPRFTVASANVYFVNRGPADAATALLASGADVIAVQEYTPHFRDAARRVGLWHAYPYRVSHPRFSPSGGALLSRLPFVEEPTVLDFEGSIQVEARVRVGDRVTTVMSVHPHAPGRGFSNLWIRQADALRSAASRFDGPAVVIGDFNAGRWHVGFRDLLSDGWRDAHEATGKGLTMSWPMQGRLPPFTRIDHALARGDIAPVSVRNLEVPGSDHLAFTATFAVRQ